MKKYLAEMVGTFVLTFLGCGAAVSLNCGVDTASVIGTAVAFGLSVVAMAYAIGGISGCHINPAITLGVFLSGRMNSKDCGMYMLFQVIGAIIAAALLAFLVSTDPGLARGTATGANACASDNVMNGLVAEIVLTFIFVLVVLGATSKTNGATNNFAGRSRPDSYSLGRYQLHRYFCQPSPFYRSCTLRGWQGTGSALGIHRRSFRRWCSCRLCLETD